MANMSEEGWRRFHERNRKKRRVNDDFSSSKDI